MGWSVLRVRDCFEGQCLYFSVRVLGKGEDEVEGKVEGEDDAEAKAGAEAKLDMFA